MLACCRKLTLCIRELLTSGLKPPFQLRYLSVAGGQDVRCSRKLCLQIIPLLCRLALDLSLFPGEPIPLGACIGKLCLCGCLRFSGLLQTALGLRQLVLELREALRLRRDIATDLIGL